MTALRELSLAHQDESASGVMFQQDDLDEYLDALKPIGLNALLNTHCVMPDHGHELMDHLASK